MPLTLEQANAMLEGPKASRLTLDQANALIASDGAPGEPEVTAEPVVDIPSAAIRGIPRGAQRMLGSTVAGLSAQVRPDDNLPRLDALEAMVNAGDTQGALRYFVEGEGKTLGPYLMASDLTGQNANEAIGRARQQIMGVAAPFYEDGRVGDLTAHKGVQAGRAISEDAETRIPVPEEAKGHLAVQVGEGVGSLLTALGLRMLPGGQVLAPAEFMGATAGEALETAIDRDATPEQMKTAATLGALPGVTDVAPLELLLRPVERKLPGARGVIAAIAKKALKQGLIEGGQESVQQWLLNGVSRIAHTPDQEMAEGVKQSGLVGFIVGALFGGAAGGMARPATAEETMAAPAAEPQTEPEVVAEVIDRLAPEQPSAVPRGTAEGPPSTPTEAAPGTPDMPATLTLEEAQQALDEDAPPPREAGVRPTPQPRVRKPYDIVSYLRSLGGVQDQGGDLRAMGALRQRPGLVNNRSGISLDEALKRAAEDGYFPQTTDYRDLYISDLLDAVDETLRGRRRYSEQDRAVLQEAEDRRAEELQGDPGVLEHEIRAVATDYGIPDADEADLDDLAIAIAEIDAVRDVDAQTLEEYADSAARAAERAENDALGDIPFEAGGRGTPASEPGPDQPAEAPTGEGPAAPRTRGADAREGGEIAPVTERTDQGDNYLLPGTKPISDADRLRARADKPLSPDRTQKPADEGLFDVKGRKQVDLIDTARKPEKHDRTTVASWKIADADRDAIAQDVIDIVDQIAPQANLEVVNRLFAVQSDGRRSEQAGSYNPAETLIRVALDSPKDPRDVAGHEGIHALKDMGLFTNEEWTELERYAPDWRTRYGIDEGYPELDETARLEEAIAERFADWMKGRRDDRGLVNAAFERVRAFLARLSNLLRGRGYRSADDIFERVETGEVGRREPTQADVEAVEKFAKILPKKRRDNWYERQAQKVLDRLHGTRVAQALTPLSDIHDRNTYLEARYRALGKVAKADEVARQVYKTFKDASPEDAQKVYDYLTTQGADPSALPKDPELRRGTTALKSQINAIGKALVNRGLLSEEALAEHGDAYLPRVYLKYLLPEGAISTGAGRKTSDLGYLKGRKDIPEEVRKVILGEITDPGFLGSLAVGRPMRDMAILDFLEEISGNDEWVMPESMVEWDGQKVSVQWLSHEADRLRKQAQYMDPPFKKQAFDRALEMDRVADPILKDMDKGPNDYKKVPDSPRYGRLRGIYVHKDVYDDVVGSIQFVTGGNFMERLFGMGGFLTKAQRVWKLSKVPLNPPSQVRNFVSNGILLHLSGVPFTRVPDRVVRAAHEMATDGKHWKIAKKYGVNAATFTANELPRIRREFLHLKARKGNAWDKMFWLGGFVAEKAGDTYQVMEGLFKTAKIIDAMERQGLSESEAALEAHKWLFDYSLVTPEVQYLRNAPMVGAPFLTFQVKAFPRVLEVAAKHPQRFLPYVVMAQAMALAAMTLNDIGEEDLEKLKKALPGWLRRKGNVHILPVKDDNGRWQAVDIGYFYPWAMFPDAAAEIGRGEWAEAFKNTGLFGTPVNDLITGLTANKDTFTGREIWNEFDPPETQAHDLVTYLWRLGAPTWLTDIGASTKLYDALSGEVDPRTGEPKETVAQALARFAGVNVYPIDPVSSRGRNLARMEYEIRGMERRMASKLRDRSLSADEKAQIRRRFRALIADKAKKMREYAKESRLPDRLR